MLPTGRTLARLKAWGWVAGTVEQTIRPPGGRPFKRDLFGCIDIVAVSAGRPITLAIQATGQAGHALERVRKALDEPRLIDWLDDGGPGLRVFEVWGWRTLKPRGTKVVRWHVLCHRITMTASKTLAVEQDVISLADPSSVVPVVGASRDRST